MKKMITLCTMVCISFTVYSQNCFVSVDSYTDATCPTSCNGTADASGVLKIGDSPKSILWTPGNLSGWSVTGLCPGTYTCTLLTTKGCSSTAQVTIGPSPFSLNISKTNPSCGTCPNGSATANVSGGTSGYNYSWSPGGQTNQTATGLTAGTYTVYVTDANSCGATPSVVTLTTTTSMNASALISGLKIYPIPMASQINIELENNGAVTATIVLSNVLGEVIYTEVIEKTGSFQTTMNTSSFDAGMYFITIHTTGGDLVQKIVKY